MRVTTKNRKKTDPFLNTDAPDEVEAVGNLRTEKKKNQLNEGTKEKKEDALAL
jgi:hypothetical protein